MAFDIVVLPVETIARILSFLDLRDLVSVSEISRFFYDIIHTFPQLQYKFTLQLYGLKDSDPTVDVRRKIAEVERRERAWRTLDLSRKSTVNVSHQTSHIYDLSGGVYVLGDCKRAVISRNTKTLRYWDLSRCEPDKVAKEVWPELKVDSDIVDVGLSLAEFDLIAILGCVRDDENIVTVSLRELSTGLPHPLAKQPDITVCRAPSNLGKCSIMMEIVGSRLVLLLTWMPTSLRNTSGNKNALYLINWWDGNIVAAEAQPKIMWDGFVFLTEDLILLPTRDSKLEVIRLPDPAKNEIRSFERVAAFGLPQNQPTCTLGIIQCRAEPNPTGTPHPTLNTEHADFAARLRARKRSPVVPDPMKSLVLLQLYYREFNSETDAELGLWGVLRHNVSLAIKRQALLDVLEEATEKDLFVSPTIFSEGGWEDDASKSKVIPWLYWGPHTRWHANDVHVSNWITVSAGQRYIGTDMEGHIIVKDYNEHTVRRARILQKKALSQTDVPDIMEVLRSNLAEIDEIEAPRRRLRSGSSLRSITVPPVYDSASRITTSNRGSMTPVGGAQPTSSIPSDAAVTNDINGLELGDTSWAEVRVVDEYDEEEFDELRRLFKEANTPLPCVEYRSKYPMEYHGYLMDEERIICLKYEDSAGTIDSFDVYTL